MPGHNDITSHCAVSPASIRRALLTALAVGLLAAFLAPPPPAHAQQVDESYVDLSVVQSEASVYTARNNGTATAYGVTVDFEFADQRFVDNNVPGDFNLNGGTACSGNILGTKCLSGVWTVGPLGPGEEASFTGANRVATGVPTGVRRIVPTRAVIKNTVPVEEERFKGDNDVVEWMLASSSAPRIMYASYWLEASVDDPLPDAGETVSFTFKVNSLGGAQGSVRDVKVRLKLDDGMGAPTATPPSGTTFAAVTDLTRTWDWDFDLPANVLSRTLEVSTTLDSQLPAGVALSDICLTAEMTAAGPNNLSERPTSVEICLREDPVTLFHTGETDLFDLFPCVGVTTYPCSSTDTLELVVNGREAAEAAGVRKVGARFEAIMGPGDVIIQVKDPDGRGQGVWRSGSKENSDANDAGIIPGVPAYARLPSLTYNQYTFAISDSTTGGKPGNVRILTANNTGFLILDIDNQASSGPFSVGTSVTSIPLLFEFGNLGIYKMDITLGATHRTSSAVYSDTSTYTFHVGPIAELSVHDGGSNAEVAADQRAFTIVAASNGPDDAPAVQATVTGLNAGDYVSHSATAGSFNSTTGVWTIGELRQPGYYQDIYGRDGEVLTIVTSAAVDTEITAAISNHQDYEVCIDSSGEDVVLSSPSSTACTAEDATNTWHTAKYFDYISDNSTTTIRAKAGTGAGLPSSLSVDLQGAIAFLSWQPVESVYGRGVSHYEVQRSAGAGQTMSTTTKGTIYVDPEGGSGNPAYRVRAVNDRGQKGPWSQSSGQRPGAPRNFSATVTSNTRIDLSWGAPDSADGVTVSGYDVEYLADGAAWTSLAAEQGALTYAHTGLTLSPGDVRQYRARTVGTVGGVKTKSDWTATSATVPGPATPGVPKSFAASGSSDTQAALSWGAPDAVAGVTVTGYELDFSKDGGNTWNWLPAGQTRTVLSATTLSHPHTDNTLAADAVRQYRLRAVGSVGGVTVRSGYTYAVATRDYPTPGAPRDFTALAVNRSQVNLSWSEPEAVSGVRLTGYHLEFSTDGNTWNRLPAAMSVLSTTTTRHEHVDAALSAGAIRQYRVRAVGQDSNNAVFESGWVFASAATEEVGAPRNLTAARDGIGRIDLTWDEPAFGTSTITGYRIDYTLGSSDAWQTLGHGYQTSPRRHEHTGLSPGQEYCYRVAAVYAGGTGPFAERDCATTEGAPTDLPGKPENLRIARLGSNYVTLQWDAPSVGGAVEYYEWRSNVHGPAEVSAASVTVRGLAPGSSYDFQVRAGNGYGPGGWSRHILVTLNRASSVVVVKASPEELEVKKGGSGSFNVRLNRSPQWPLALYTHSIGPECLTDQLAYQQGKIMLPDNLRPGKEFWEDGWWGPPDDRWAQSWRKGLDIRIDASGCRGGETTVVEYSLYTVPFSYLEGQPMWEELGLNEEEWREKWGVDPLDGISGPSVKVTVVDGD